MFLSAGSALQFKRGFEMIFVMKNFITASHCVFCYILMDNPKFIRTILGVANCLIVSKRSTYPDKEQ